MKLWKVTNFIGLFITIAMFVWAEVSYRRNPSIDGGSIIPMTFGTVALIATTISTIIYMIFA